MGVYHKFVLASTSIIDGVEVANVNHAGKAPGFWASDKVHDRWEQKFVTARKIKENHLMNGVKYMRCHDLILNIGGAFNDTSDFINDNIVGRIVKKGRKNVIEWV